MMALASRDGIFMHPMQPVHMDMKSHTGGAMTLGKGSIYSTSVKQKLMTHSLTEAEVVVVHDVMPQMLLSEISQLQD
jgi:hypothetical protein